MPSKSKCCLCLPCSTLDENFLLLLCFLSFLQYWLFFLWRVQGYFYLLVKFPRYIQGHIQRNIGSLENLQYNRRVRVKSNLKVVFGTVFFADFTPCTLGHRWGTNILVNRTEMKQKRRRFFLNYIVFGSCSILILGPARVFSSKSRVFFRGFNSVF